MINRIVTVEAPGNGRSRALPPPASAARATGKQLDQQLRQFIGDHPALSLAIGFTIGIVVGCLIKRR